MNHEGMGYGIPSALVFIGLAYGTDMIPSFVYNQHAILCFDNEHIFAHVTILSISTHPSTKLEFSLNGLETRICKRD
jgi:hypothetical protein